MPSLTPAQAQWVTLLFVVAVTAGAIGFDVLMIRHYGMDASISRVLRRLFTRYPVLFASVLMWLGILIGHILLATSTD